jgi:hypothetical protein
MPGQLLVDPERKIPFVLGQESPRLRIIFREELVGHVLPGGNGEHDLRPDRDLDAVLRADRAVLGVESIGRHRFRTHDPLVEVRVGDPAGQHDAFAGLPVGDLDQGKDLTRGGRSGSQLLDGKRYAGRLGNGLDGVTGASRLEGLELGQRVVARMCGLTHDLRRIVVRGEEHAERCANRERHSEEPPCRSHVHSLQSLCGHGQGWALGRPAPLVALPSVPSTPAPLTPVTR